MKRVKAACIFQTLVFFQKEDCGLSKELQVKYNHEDVEKYKNMLICDYLSFLGLKIDPELNEQMVLGKEGKISTPDSTIEVWVIPTNEELVIARDTKALVEAM